MYSSNFHSHNSFCDGSSSMEEFVCFALSEKLNKYGFSSHAPLPFHTSWSMNISDFSDYHREFLRLKKKYKGKIELYFGLEVDYIEGCTDANDNFYKSHQFDFLIGSVHFLDKTEDGIYWSVDGHYHDFQTGLNQLYEGDIVAAVRRFFDVSNQMIDKGGFDIVGHVDKIMMHALKFKNFSISDKYYQDLMQQTFENIRRRGLLLEINTKSLIEFGYTYPHKHFFSIIKEMKIPLVLNSDCHYTNKITDGFALALAELKKSGIKELFEFSEGKWCSVGI